jgi:hypothetical protein
MPLAVAQIRHELIHNESWKRQIGILSEEYCDLDLLQSWSLILDSIAVSWSVFKQSEWIWTCCIFDLHIHFEKEIIFSLTYCARMMKQDSTLHDSWYFHPSWAMLWYHRALCYFQIGGRDRCSSLIQALWNHQLYVLPSFAIPNLIALKLWQHFWPIRLNISEGTWKPSRFIPAVNRTSPILSVGMWSCVCNFSERLSHTNLFERRVFKSWS